MRDKSRIAFLSLMLSLMLLTGCVDANRAEEVGLTTEIEPTTTSNVLDRDQSVYFNCIATDGLAAYSLAKVLYEQPELKKNIIFEYSLYNNSELIMEALDSDKANIAIFPFKLASEILIHYDNYKMVGVVKGDNHLLLGITSYLDLEGKEIVIFDPSGIDDAYSTTIGRIQYEAKQLGLVYGEDYDIRVARSTDGFNSIADDDVLLIDARALEEEPYHIYRETNDYITIDESKDYQLAVLMEDSIIDIYPEIVSTFVEAYYRSCLWLSAYPERARAYATQLNLTPLMFEHKSFYYFDATKNSESIDTLLSVLDYNVTERERILTLIYEVK